MASHSSPPPRNPCVPPPNWLELPDDVSASILRRLDPVDILTSAQHVCTTWRRICRDPSMWTSISIGHRRVRWTVRHKLPPLYRHAVDWSSGGLLDVDFEDYASGDLLRYIADRSNNLRRFRLVYCGCEISDIELIEVAGKLPFLEELELSYCRFSSEVVAAFGRLCPRIHSFKLKDHRFNRPDSESDDEAFAIAENMPGLHHLQVFVNKLTNAGLISILDGCQQLESLDLSRCFHIDLDADLKRRCTEQIKHFRGPNDSSDDSDSDDSDSDDSDDSESDDSDSHLPD